MKNIKDRVERISDDPNTQLAHEVAQEMGYENAKELMEQTNDSIKSPNKARGQAAKAVAAEFTTKLALLILYQEIENPTIPYSRYNWAKKFNDDMISNGNSKEFSMNLPTGNDSYDDNNFVPTKASSPQIETKIISMYTERADGTRELAPNAYRYLKPLTINEAQWYPYFIAGKLGEFVSKITSLMRASYDLFVINKMENYIKNMTFNKTITGNGNGNTNKGTNQDMFACLVNEVIPNIEKMTYLNTEYNLSANSKNISASEPSDILVFTNNNIKSKLRTGVQSRTFNASLISLNDVIPAENWIGTAGSVEVGDSDTVISIGQDWIDDNTIYVLSKNAIRHCLQVDRTETQAWAQNMTLQIVLHVWGTIGDLPWEKGFKYVSDKLSVLPN